MVVNHMSNIETSPGRYGAWTPTGLAERRGSNKFVECLCVCGTRRLVLETRLKAGQSRSCGCLRGVHVAEGRALSALCLDGIGEHRPPNGYAVVLEGSVRGPKWAAGAPELTDPWYVGPVESRCALRFGSRSQAREWIGRRRVAVRYPGTMSVVALWFEEAAPRWLPVPLVSALRAAAPGTP